MTSRGETEQSACREDLAGDHVDDVTRVPCTSAAREAARRDDKAQSHKRTWSQRALGRKSLVSLVTFSPEDAPPRPMRRADCIDGPRPCPWLSCRHHLALDVGSSGSITVYPPADEDGELALEAMADTCSLDVADRGEHTLEEVGEVLGVVRERVRQIVDVALERVRRQRAVRQLIEAA